MPRSTSKASKTSKPRQTAAEKARLQEIASLIATRETETSPGRKAALTKSIQALGGTVPGQTVKLTAEGIAEARQSGDTVDSLLSRMGFDVNAARKARVAYLVNRGEVKEFSPAS